MTYKLTFLSILTLCLNTETTSARAYTMRTIPDNGINVMWPVLHDTQYFTYKGLHARNVTLKSVMALDTQHIIDKYDDNPELLMAEIELVILVQYALRGLNIQAMKPQVRIDLARAEILKRLRQYGRITETKAYLGTPSIIPSIGALTHIVEKHREDLLRQMYHTKQQWDLHKISSDDQGDNEA